MLFTKRVFKYPRWNCVIAGEWIRTALMNMSGCIACAKDERSSTFHSSASRVTNMLNLVRNFVTFVDNESHKVILYFVVVNES